MAPSGHTRVAGVVGDPVRHSLSPAIHNAVLDALSPYGVRHIDMPLTPMKVWKAVASA